MVEVQLKKVTKKFGDTKAVDDVTLQIRRGEFFFLLGPSGCGKTTCLRIIAGFYQPDSGDIHFDGKLMNKVPPYKRNTGMVFQNYALWPHMSVYENVEYGLSVRNIPNPEREQKVFKALEIVRMNPYADRTPNQLSGGQQQRIALARALVIEPDVLLLDEPLSNLDAKLRLEMRQELKRIHAETNITSLYVTHDQKEALSLADRIAVMMNGKVVQVGTPREIYNRPVDKFVADFIGETNFIDGKLISIGQIDQIAQVESPIGLIFANLSGQSDQGERNRTVAVGVGKAVTCSIRPESIKVYDRPIPNAQNQFESKLVNFTYLGDIEESLISTKDNLLLKAIIYNPTKQARRIGDKVFIAFDPQDVIVLDKE